MSLFIDASALVALAREEDDAPLLLEQLATDMDRRTSPIALWETFRALAKGSADGDALAEAERLLETLDIRLIPISAAEASEAMRAHARYGKGTGHPARLNMGDCFAYACARTNNARLLYKGDDFTHTDMGR